MSNDKTVIVGVSCRLPQIDSLDALWDCLTAGKSVVGSDRYGEQYVGGFIDNIGNFDAGFFNISPREAMFLDPQVRILLEKVQHAIEDSTLTIKELQKLKCGVFVTSLPGDYKYLVEKSDKHSHFGFAGNSFSSLSGRVSFFYNFNGPSISVDTACSSGLYAMQLAEWSLRSNQCQAAIVGGVTLFSTNEIFLMLNNAMISSKKGLCLPFSKNADGLIPSEACVCFILTKKSIASELNLPIYAEIEAIGVNHDGLGRGFMCPNAVAQANLLNEIYANVDPNQLAYLETHGTGTIVGDEMELEGLRMAVEDQISGKLTLGASKALVGHSLVTSGLVSVAKAIACFRYNIVPKVHHLKYQDVVNRISSKFEFNAEAKQINEEHCMIGVSAFGFTGSNGHIVLKKEKKEKKYRNNRTPKHFIFPVSAKSSWSLINILKNIRSASQDSNLEQLEAVLQCSLNSFKIRIVFVASTVSTLCAEIDDFLNMVNEKSKIQNKVIDVLNLLTKSKELDGLIDWVKSGNEAIFAARDRKLIENLPYRNKYPFHEQYFWIKDDTNVTSSSLTNNRSVEFLREYLSLDDSFQTTQISWLTSFPNSKNHIVLLPPLNGDYKMWYFQIRRFTREGFQLHIPFYPYHGKLSKRPPKIDFEQLIEELSRYIVHIKKQQYDSTVNIIGWSIGGCFALLLGIKYPSILSRMCLISTAANFSSDVFEKTLDIQCELNNHIKDFQIIYEKKGTINELLSAGTDMVHLKDFYDFLGRFDISGFKGGFSFPCLVIYGEKDKIITQEKIEKLVNIISARKIKFPYGGHFIPLINPVTFNDVILNFFQARGE